MSMAARQRQYIFHYRRGAARFIFFYYRRGAVAIFYFPSRRGSGRCSAAMDISAAIH
jgi:hypothetical protein